MKVAGAEARRTGAPTGHGLIDPCVPKGRMKQRLAKLHFTRNAGFIPQDRGNDDRLRVTSRPGGGQHSCGMNSALRIDPAKSISGSGTQCPACPRNASNAAKSASGIASKPVGMIELFAASRFAISLR